MKEDPHLAQTRRRRRGDRQLRSDFAVSEEMDTGETKATLRERNCNEHRRHKERSLYAGGLRAICKWMVPIATGSDEGRGAKERAKSREGERLAVTG
jgi:hypothetical protein